MQYKSVATMLLIAANLLQSACSALILSPVADADRDISNRYDGSWKFETNPLNSVQTIGSVNFRCEFREEMFVMQVKDGVGQLHYGTKIHKANIAGNGTFRFEIPTEHIFKTTTGNNDVKNRLTLIYQGRLNRNGSRGLYTRGHEGMNNSGCSTKVTITSMQNKSA